jgi:hypothetical protein
MSTAERFLSARGQDRRRPLALGCLKNLAGIAADPGLRHKGRGSQKQGSPAAKTGALSSLLSGNPSANNASPEVRERVLVSPPLVTATRVRGECGWPRIGRQSPSWGQPTPPKVPGCGCFGWRQSL